MKTFTNLAHRAFKKCASLGTINKKRYYLFIITMLLTLGVGNAWAADVTETITMKGFAGIATSGYQNVTRTGASDAGTAMVAYAFNPGNGQVRGNKTTVAGASVTSEDKNKNWSLYNSQAMGGAIKSITITQTATGNNKFQNEMYVSLGTTSQGAVTTITNAQKHTSLTTSTIQFDIDPTKGYTYFKLLSTKSFTGGSVANVVVTVTYETSGGGETPETPVASLSATPTTINFGTVYQGSSVANQTVTVNFENLNDNVTYSGLSTPFTATGTVSNDGDKITIAANTTTIGDYTQTLTITSAADSKTAEVTVKMNVVEKPAPTGTFTLHTGALVEGDYVIVSTNSLKAEVNSDRLASLPVTISNDEIVDPDATTIWHIAKSGEYWTLYNANKAKYAASTGAKNKAALLNDATDDKALWSVTGTSTYEFVNKKNAASAVNANLRYNSQNAENSRWACYSTSTGAALSLYRKAGEKYDVKIADAITNGTVTADPTSAEAGTTITLTVAPDAGYVLDALTVTDASSNTVTVTNNEFTMPASDVTITATFKLNEKPAATLTLSKNGVTEDITGNKQDDVVTLPSITSDCVKEFVGWSANPTCNVAPEYEDGDEYTLAATTQTLYAVYATVEGGEATASVDMATYATDNSWGSSSSTNQKEININSDLKAVISEGGNSGKYYNDGVRIYQTEDATVTVSTTVGELKSVKFTFTIANNGTLLHEGVAMTSDEAVEVSGNSAVFTVGDTHATENKGQVRFTAIEVVYTGGVTYSDYSTTCAAALEKPTFSVAESTYTEAKSIELNATEGDIYYTLDDTEPTKLSTLYTDAIVLDECGTTTIKAIAISTESQSPVASATYTINLPITNTAATAYTPVEAIAIIDGECDKTEEVFVKGVVVSTSEFNSTYGNYDVIVKAVDDNSATPTTFTFYRMYKAASNTKFTESDEVIGVGDIITAKGKLKKFNSTYELAEGCYMVERVAFTEPKTDISNTLETAYTVDKAFELISDVKSDLDKEVYVKGLVAVASTQLYEEKYLTYSISDNGQTTGNVLKVYDGLNIDGVAFTSKDDVKVGDYVVVKGKLLNYGGTYEINKDNQLVQHVKAATIKIADITMEVGETKTIAATITPAAAETAVVYTIKENTDNAISLSGNTITANAVGTATITATIATAAEYMGKTVEFTVTVTPESTSDEVVILAELEGKWYAMKGAVPTGKSNQLDALEVTYFNGTLYNVAESDKASITWTRSVVDGKATFVNNGKYLKGDTDTDLTLSASVDDKCKWIWDDEKGYYTTNTSGTIRTFLYRNGYNFKNYGVSQAGKEDANGNYSELPVVTAPVYETGDVTYTRATTAGKFGTICLPFGSTNYTGMELFECVGQETGKVYIASVTTLEAGVPYIFLATGTELAVYSDGTTAATPGDHNGLHGTFTDDTEVAVGNYILKDNALCQAEAICWVNAYRAYIVWDEIPTGAPQQMPGRRYISMDAKGENTTTGLDNITNGENTTIKVIENGQLIIIRNGEKFNAQGQKL